MHALKIAAEIVGGLILAVVILVVLIGVKVEKDSENGINDFE